MTISSNISLIESGIQAAKETIQPTIRFSFDCEIDYYTFIYNKKGDLWLGPKKLTSLVEKKLFNRGSIGELSWDKPDGRPFSRKKRYPRFTLEGELSNAALELIEEEREKHPKGDIEFRVQIALEFFVGTHEVHSSKLTHADTQRPIPLIKLRHNDTLFEVHATEQTIVAKVSFSDWISDFMPVFGLDKVVIYELPVFDTNGLEGNFSKKIAAALEALDTMTGAKNRADWNAVIKESRHIWELVKDRTFNEKLFLGSGLNIDAAKELQTVIFHFFEFTSKFNHKLAKDKTTVMESLNAQKEDALLVYTMALNVVNTILEKVKRLKNYK